MTTLSCYYAGWCCRDLSNHHTVKHAFCYHDTIDRPPSGAILTLFVFSVTHFWHLPEARSHILYVLQCAVTLISRYRTALFLLPQLPPPLPPYSRQTSNAHVRVQVQHRLSAPSPSGGLLLLHDLLQLHRRLACANRSSRELPRTISFFSGRIPCSYIPYRYIVYTVATTQQPNLSAAIQGFQLAGPESWT